MMKKLLYLIFFLLIPASSFAALCNSGTPQSVITITSSCTSEQNDKTIKANATGGNITITLESCVSSRKNVEHYFIRIDTSGNTVTLNPAGAETVNGAASALLTASRGTLILTCDGAGDWLGKGGYFSGIGIGTVGSSSIANDSITEPKLKATNAPTDEYCLTYEITIGDFEWQPCSSGSGHTIQDEGGDLASEPKLNFTGAGVTCTDNAGVSTDCAIPGGSGHTIQEEGSDLAAEPKLNFLGSTITCVDNAGVSTDCTISGASSHNLLDGSVHPDTVAHTVAQGEFVIGNATPKWDYLAANTTGTKKFLSETSSVASWVTIAFTDLTGSLSLTDLSDVTITSATRGDILYRGASDWNNLAASSGKFLKSNGTGSDPTWEDISGGVADSAAVKWSGVITPSQITANQNNYAPTGCSTSSTIRLDSDAAYNITGISCSQSTGMFLLLQNIGAYNLTLKNEDSNSTAANQFLFSSDQVIHPKETFIVVYDDTSDRWRPAMPSQITFPGPEGDPALTPNTTNFHGWSVAATSNQSVGASTHAALLFQSEYIDSDGFHSNLTDNERATIPTGMGGDYVIGCGVVTSSSSSGANGIHYIHIGKNGTSTSNRLSTASYTPVSGSTSITGFTNSITLATLSDGDYVECSLDNVGNGTVTVADGTNSGQTMFWGFRIEATGHFVKVGKTATQSIADGTPPDTGMTLMTWNQEAYDTDAYHDNSTNNERITIPSGRNGLYLTGCDVQITQPNSNVSTSRATVIEKNGSGSGGRIAGNELPAASNNASPGDYGVGAYSLVQLGVGDYLECKAMQNSGSSANSVATSNNEAPTAFWAVQINSGNGAKVGKTANQTTAAAVEALTFNQEFVDTNSYHDNATNNQRLTIGTGLGAFYIFGCDAYSSTAPTPVVPFGIFMNTKSSTTLLSETTWGQAAQPGTQGQAIGIAFLDDADYIQCYKDNTTAWTIVATSHLEAETAFWLANIGL